MPIFKSKSKAKEKEPSLVYGEGQGSVVSMDLPSKNKKGWKRVFPGMGSKVVMGRPMHHDHMPHEHMDHEHMPHGSPRRGSFDHGSNYSAGGLTERAFQIHNATAGHDPRYEHHGTPLPTIVSSHSRQPTLMMGVPPSQRGSIGPSMMMGQTPIDIHDPDQPVYIMDGAHMDPPTRQPTVIANTVITGSGSRPHSPHIIRAGSTVGPGSTYSAGAGPPPGVKTVTNPVTGKTYQEYSGNVVLIVDEDAELEIGNEQDGFIPYSEYMNRPRPEEEVFMVNGGANFIFQDEEGNTLRDVTGTPEHGQKVRGTYVKNVDGSFSVYP